MTLEKNEFTYASLIQHLSKLHGKKLSGKDFNASDVFQYAKRGYLPYRYSGKKLTSTNSNGIVILTLHDNTVMPKSKKGKKVK